jgi:hypothetical protein
MKNIYLIPTDKRTRLHYDHTGLFLSHHYQVSKEINSIVEGRYIYITSDEYIGLNWYIDGGWVRKGVIDDKDYWSVRKDYKKIVITNDPKLIKDGVQDIGDGVMDWFIENPTCEYFNIEQYNSYGIDNWKYLVTLPTDKIDFEKELSKWGYNKGNSIDVEILVNEILPKLFEQFKK